METVEQRGRVSCCNCTLKTFRRWSVGLLISGLLLIILGSIFELVIKEATEERVRDKVIVCEFSSEDYGEWSDLRKLSRDFYFFSVNNVASVLANGKPQMTTMGPYKYNIIKRKINVQFQDINFQPSGGCSPRIQYQEWLQYHYTEEGSCTGCNPLTDKVNVVNPYFLGLVEKGGSDAGLYFGFVSGSVTALQQFDGTSSFLGANLLNALPTLLYNPAAPTIRSMLRDSSQVVQEKILSQAVSSASAPDWTAGLNQWADATHSAVAVIESGFEIGLNISTTPPTKAPLNTQVASLQKLFNTDGSNSAYALSTRSGMIQWFNATNVPALMKEFSFTQAQVVSIMEWLNPSEAFFSKTSPSYLKNLLNNVTTELGAEGTPSNVQKGMSTAATLMGYEAISAFEDLGLLQWSSSFLTCGFSVIANAGDGTKCAPSIANVDSSKPLVEFSAWASTNSKVNPGNSKVCDMSKLQIQFTNLPLITAGAGTPDREYFYETNCNFFTLAQTKAIWSHLTGLKNSTVFSSFLGMYKTASISASMLTTLGGISSAQANLLGEYIVYMFLASASAMKLNNVDSGIFTTRTINELIFGYLEPSLAALLGSTNPAAFVGFYPNITNLTDATKFLNTSTMDSGSLNWFQAGVMMKWNATGSISGGLSLPIGSPWAAPEIIRGHDARGFGACSGVNLHCYKHRKGEVHFIWEENTLRALAMENKNGEQVSVGSFDKALRFRMRPDALYNAKKNPENAKFYMNYDGLAPMVTAKGSPFFVSKPYFMDCNASWNNALIGHDVIMPANRDIYDSFLDIEAISGRTLKAQKFLQVNVMIENSKLATYYPGLTSGGSNLIPVYAVNENGGASDSDVDEVEALYLMLEVKLGVFISFTVFGAILCITGLVMYWIWRKKMKALSATVFQDPNYTQRENNEFGTFSHPVECTSGAPVAMPVAPQTKGEGAFGTAQVQTIEIYE
eukprot:Nk52_evm80s215 gene=Nk52_evmTU80s215